MLIKVQPGWFGFLGPGPPASKNLLPVTRPSSMENLGFSRASVAGWVSAGQCPAPATGNIPLTCWARCRSEASMDFPLMAHETAPNLPASAGDPMSFIRTCRSVGRPAGSHARHLLRDQLRPASHRPDAKQLETTPSEHARHRRTDALPVRRLVRRVSSQLSKLSGTKLGAAWSGAVSLSSAQPSPAQRQERRR